MSEPLLPQSPQRRSEADDPRASPARLSRLAADANLHVRRAAAANPSTPRHILTLLRRAGSTADLSAFARPDSTLTVDEIQQLVELGEWGMRLAARHPATPSHVLQKLVGEPLPLLLCDVARHANTPADALASLCTDASQEVRRAASANPNAPAALIHQLQAVARGDDVDAASLEKLADLGVWARIIVARHRATPPRLLAKLAEDKHWQVRAAVAENHSINGQMLMKLVNPDDPAVHMMLAKHPNTPPEVLTRLATVGRAEVREIVARHPALPGSFVQMLRRAGSNRELTGFVEPDATLPAEVLVELSQGGGWARQLAARHPNTPRATLVELARGNDAMVRLLVSRHPNLPPELAESLASDWTPAPGSKGPGSSDGSVA